MATGFMFLNLNSLAVHPCHQRLRIVCWVSPVGDVSIDSIKYKAEAVGSLPDTYLRLKRVNQAEGKFEQEQKQPVFPALTRRDKSAIHSTSEKADQLRKALNRLHQQGSGTTYDTYVSLLRQCANTKSLSDGKRLHAHIMKAGYDRSGFLGALVVRMYGTCGNLEDARAAFDRISQPNTFSWNIMIAAYAQNGHLDDAMSVFDKMPERNVVSWNTMIAAYARSRHANQAFEVFRRMHLEGVRPNKITFICLLDACSCMAALSQGKVVHVSIVQAGFESDVVVGTSLINMYGKCGSLDDARRVFNKMVLRNVVSWTATIAAYAQNGHGKEALELFRQMVMEGVKPNKITFICILEACANLEALAQGKRIHACIVDDGFESDLVVGNALVNMYGKCGSLDDARSMFDKMRHRDVVSWNAIISAYAQNDHGKEAVELFQRMELLEGVKPNKVTFICVLDACSSLAALEHGKGIHSSIVQNGFETDVAVSNCLCNMYGKCGNLDDARSVFDRMPQRDVISWTAMIAAYAQNGLGKEALKLFRSMDLEDRKPNEITLISILSACSHAGLLDDGWHYFVSLSRDYDITPTMEHYGCMIDLVGRDGQLDEAEDLINNIPVNSDAVAWMTLLGACRLHGDLERGVRATDRILELDPKNAAPYVLISNIFAAAGRQDDVAKVRKAMEVKGTKKHSGFSRIEIKDRVNSLLQVTDISHPQKEEIYAELQRLGLQM